ncbi:MAG TPA: sensor histidine kinase KdpD [Roseiflexaceae bacterium]|nr:sensor histidine kinase KdpD [Roseiflexaceae bacterium]
MEQRPDPDALLARVKQDEARQQRGTLKVFFGMAAGVGKTYAMLEAARERKAEGVDVVAGYVEPHGRTETEALLEGLEQLAPRAVEYRGTVLRAFDLDAALARRPQLILVDELAHSNAPGSRHPKRYQDIEELLAAGIDVYTTVNVQHLESLNDVIAQITGVIVRETVPDRLIEQADEVELVDLTPDDLLARLKEGKVYVPQQAERAAHNFFRKGNLHALRELALRTTADRVDAQMEAYRRDKAIRDPWPATVRLLVGVSSGPAAARLVRAARRMAVGLRAAWVVAYVETPSELRRPEPERDQAVQTLRLAESLGAETVTLSGPDAADALLAYARERNISKVVIGKPERSRWQDVLFGSVADDLIRKSGVIDVYVLSGDFADAERPLRAVLEPTSDVLSYLWAPVVVAITSAVTLLLDRAAIGEANLIMVFLLGVLAVALSGGRGPSVLATIMSVLAFNFLFVEPRLSFAVTDTRYLITFSVMLVVGLTVSTLVARFRWQAEAAQARERRTAALYALSRELASVRGLDNLVRAAVRHVSEVFGSRVVLLMPTGRGRLQPWGSISGWARDLDPQQVFSPDASDQGVAQWVFDRNEMAGLGTSTLSAAEAVYLPLAGAQRTVGVLGVRPDHPRRVRAPEQIHLLETFANQIALAVERATLAQEAERAQVTAETERMRAALLSSVSHDLRTPLAVITGATSSLLQDGDALDEPTRRELLQTAYGEAEWLNRLVGNLLNMTRLEAGVIQVRKEWQPLEEVVGAALARLAASRDAAAALRERPLSIDLPPTLPLVPLDGVLIEQVLVNLLHNALTHTPPGTPVAVRAWEAAGEVVVEVADRGPGLPPGSEGQVFDKFYHGQTAGRGVGLGLAICRGMVEAHGGRIWAEQRPDGGVGFRFSLPLTGLAPVPRMEDPGQRAEG